MSETDPGYSEQHAGDVGARRARVGTPTERESVNVPPTRPGAAENAQHAEEERAAHETFVPEPPVRDERAEAAENQRAEEETVPTPRGTQHDPASPLHGVRHQSASTGRWTRHQEDVRKDIEETRRQLGDTVSALAAKADVKSRASHAAGAARERAAGMAGSVKGKASEVAGRLLMAAGGAAVVVAVGSMMRDRRRRSR
ncbi:DUF3618 domain-containing protein [Nonomuraea sp. NPDC049784]|uniref:DUF3618 domain-containing protein n=1 Tax=Nonomuraea sp. NPDC049784 TaxID=3154361 RepID=UPI0033C8452F